MNHIRMYSHTPKLRGKEPLLPFSFAQALFAFAVAMITLLIALLS